MVLPEERNSEEEHENKMLLCSCPCIEGWFILHEKNQSLKVNTTYLFSVMGILLSLYRTLHCKPYRKTVVLRAAGEPYFPLQNR
jgi:hypothetical protein